MCREGAISIWLAGSGSSLREFELELARHAEIYSVIQNDKSEKVSSTAFVSASPTAGASDLRD